MREKGKEIDSVFLLFNAAIFFSVLSQLNDDDLVRKIRPIMYLTWILLYLVVIHKNKLVLYGTVYGIPLLVCYTAFIIFCLIMSIFNLEFLKNTYILPFTISVTMYFLGVQLYKLKFSIISINKCLLFFCILIFILSIYIHLNNFINLNVWMQSLTYGYQRKNSAGQLIVVTVIILIYFFEDSDRKYKLLRYVIAFYMFFVLLLIQCRAAILSLCCVVAFRFVHLKKGKLKCFFIGLFIIVILFSNERFITILRKALFIDKYAGQGINEFSSGRIVYLTDALDVFKQNVLFGAGNYYVDNFYISILTGGGIISFLTIVPVILLKLFKNLKNKSAGKELLQDPDHIKLFYIIKLLSVFYLVESMLEGMPPLGPGVCAFWFWILNGYMDAEFYTQVLHREGKYECSACINYNSNNE